MKLIFCQFTSSFLLANYIVIINIFLCRLLYFVYIKSNSVYLLRRPRLTRIYIDVINIFHGEDYEKTALVLLGMFAFSGVAVAATEEAAATTSSTSTTTTAATTSAAGGGAAGAAAVGTVTATAVGITAAAVAVAAVASSNSGTGTTTTVTAAQ